MSFRDCDVRFAIILGVDDGVQQINSRGAAAVEILGLQTAAKPRMKLHASSTRVVRLGWVLEADEMRARK